MQRRIAKFVNLNPFSKSATRWWTVHALVLAVLLILDGPLFRGFHAAIEWSSTHRVFLFYELTKNRHWDFFNQFGSAWAGIVIAIFIWIYDPPKRKYLVVLAAGMVLSTSIYYVLQHSVGKLRPVVTSGVVTYLVFPQGWTQHGNLSFPSGHATNASTLTAFLTLLYPRAKWLFFGMMVACGIARVYFNAHYFSDVYAGALNGWCSTYFFYSFVFCRYSKPIESSQESSDL